MRLFWCFEFIKTPTIGYGVDFKHAMNKKVQFISLKLHDFFNMLQYTLIVAITSLIINVIHENISCLFKLVWWVYVEVVDIEKLLIMKKESVITLLDMHLLTSFFNFQVHILIHLVQEVGLVGLWQGGVCFSSKDS
jgi:hypothetical protein